MSQSPLESLKGIKGPMGFGMHREEIAQIRRALDAARTARAIRASATAKK